MTKIILWDFDGVILDSMHVRDYGFQMIFKNFQNSEVQKLLDFHRKNGGLSRYVKIRYFYEEILNQSISEDEVKKLATKFSKIMKRELIKPQYLIAESLNFIKHNHKNLKFHIVSGSDQKELQFLCKQLGLDSFFLTINGSPTPKNKLVRTLMDTYKYEPKETILIGDSFNDHEAAKKNAISFYGYNNSNLMKLSDFYIYSFDEIEL